MLSDSNPRVTGKADGGGGGDQTETTFPTND